LSVKRAQIVQLMLTLHETRMVLQLLEACDGAPRELFNATKRIAKRLKIADSVARNLLK
jgi:hypothetical protein